MEYWSPVWRRTKTNVLSLINIMLMFYFNFIGLKVIVVGVVRLTCMDARVVSNFFIGHVFVQSSVLAKSVYKQRH